MPSQKRILDCHVHLRRLGEVESLEAIRKYIGADRMNLVCIFARENVNDNHAAFVAKHERPDRYYVFGSLDHASQFMPGSISTPPLAEQLERLISIGCDGVKMLENKPTHRKLVDIPIDGPYFEEYFRYVESLGFPILWHVCDPEEFWDPETTPHWAKARGWGYDDTFMPKEALYAEVENVLTRHPRLKIIFAHFYFMSADLPRAADLFDRFPNVHFDLAPGIEFLYNMSKYPDSAREFFIKYSDRILFGTDISSTHTPEEARLRTGIVTRWLETDDEYRLPEGADFVLGPPEDGIMRGLNLPDEALRKIYRGNFERLVGSKPRELSALLAAEECRRVAAEVSIITGANTEDTEAAQAAIRLSKE